MARYINRRRKRRHRGINVSGVAVARDVENNRASWRGLSTARCGVAASHPRRGATCEKRHNLGDVAAAWHRRQRETAAPEQRHPWRSWWRRRRAGTKATARTASGIGRHRRRGWHQNESGQTKQRSWRVARRHMASARSAARISGAGAWPAMAK